MPLHSDMNDAHRAPSARGTTPRNALGYAVVILLLAASLLLWHYHSRVQDFRDNQQRLMQGNVNATAVEVSNYVRHLRRSVELFVTDRTDLIQQLSSSPSDQALFERLHWDIDTHFPNHFAFTIAGADGEPMLEAMDTLVGRGCRRDIGLFAKHSDAHRIYIHSSPQSNPYHFDVMVPLGETGGETGGRSGVFFVSFFVRRIAEILRNESLPDHHLVLVREDRPDTIEVDADGAGTELLREAKLTEDELNSIGASAMAKDTRWLVYDLPNPEMLDRFRHNARVEALTAFALFALVTLIFLRLVYRSERALRRSNHDLAESLVQLEETQQQLVQSEKMAALGGLVAGVAHEINTPVGTAMTAASHLEEERQQTYKALEIGHLKKSQLQSFMDTSGDATRIVLANLGRAAELIQSFKLVASDQTHQERRRFKLDSYLQEVMLSLAPKTKHTPHRFELECPAGIEMNSYPGAIAQVVTNLLDNALTHAFTDDQPGLAKLRVEPAGERVMLEFSDDGRGMNTNTLRRVFDPFFTGNRNNGGTGLGMHIVYNLVEGKLGGHIQCFSEPGNGTRFRLDLPRQSHDQPRSP